MSETISFVIYQRATGKKAMIRGKYKNMYPSAEQLFNAESLQAEMLPHRPPEPITDPVMLYVEASFSVPASKPKWWQEAALAHRIHYSQKPDLDNIAKQIGDCLKKMEFIRDDAPIFMSNLFKGYGEKNFIKITLVIVSDITRAEWEKIKKERGDE